MAEEWVDHAYSKLKDEKARQVSAVKNLQLLRRKKMISLKLTKAKKERKNAEAALAGAKK